MKLEICFFKCKEVFRGKNIKQWLNWSRYDTFYKKHSLAQSKLNLRKKNTLH